MREKCFAYQNIKTRHWLKIERHFNIYSEKYDCRHSIWFVFDRSLMYSARNIIEEYFSRIKLEDKEYWQLMEIDVKYSCQEAEIE